MVDTWSRKPGHPKGWGFDSSSYRVHNFTPRFHTGVFRSFLTRERMGSRLERGSRGGRLHRPPRIPVSHRCGRVPVKHSSDDMGGSIPSAGTVRRHYGSSHWSALRSGMPPDASRVRTVGSFARFSAWRSRVRTPYTVLTTGRDRRKVVTLAEPSASGLGRPPARCNNRLWCNW